jgi:hypothetical protein
VLVLVLALAPGAAVVSNTIRPTVNVVMMCLRS